MLVAAPTTKYLVEYRFHTLTNHRIDSFPTAAARAAYVDLLVHAAWVIRQWEETAWQ